jgi:hypothetical protein
MSAGGGIARFACHESKSEQLRPANRRLAPGFMFKRHHGGGWRRTLGHYHTMKALYHVEFLVMLLTIISLTGCRTSSRVPLIPDNVSVVGGPSSYIKGKIAFTSSYDKEMLQDAPRWIPGNGRPPLSVATAESAASRLLSETVSDSKDWKLKEITLKQPFGSFGEVPAGFWVYHFTFDGPKEDRRVNSFITIVVLMNGKVVPLKPIEPK